ncbi:glycosyltransferase family 32 protein [Aliarcobacter trophiarum]|uniref:glycosyltransferase family 32 protein n=1 Tax=Aliarcobacter trophiarum TaxID=708186 RepID=UPI00100A4AD0|nr:glycosyltransferase [Aliarcobacter trophiarum]RXI28662.1 glycosyl transferase [Aliarcobacter trophiarum]
MYWAIIINRFCKFSGTILKGFTYIIYFIFPELRFTIPKVSKAKINSKMQTCIPKIIWQTNYTNKVTLPVYINYLFNRLMSLDWEYRYVSTEDRHHFIRENAPKNYVEAFEQLTDGAAQADFWRLFILNYIGGVYMDIDAHVVLPLSNIIKPEYKELILMTKHKYSNYFMASSKDNKYLVKTLELVVENIENKRIGNGVYDLTGPTALNKAIGDELVNHRHNKITCIQGSFTNEYFQYLDKPKGKWTHAKKEDLLKD